MFNFRNFLLRSAFGLRDSASCKRVYLDNAGATEMSARAKRALLSALEGYGNPSAIYKEGDIAKKKLDDVSKGIGEIINARKHEIYFTGTGTESCNLAITGTYLAWKKENPYTERIPHMIISSIEHPAVMEVVNYLSINSLINVTYLPVYENGIVKVEDIRKALTDETILVSIMYANNEIGTIQPILKIGRFLEEARSKKQEARRKENSRSEFSSTKNEEQRTNNYPLFHTDACQATNYLDLDVYRLKVDLMTINGSKIYGPKGIAVLYKKEGVHLEPVILGGGQERNLRSGTENLPLVVSFLEALKETNELKEKESKRLRLLRDYLKNELSKAISGIKFYGAFDEYIDTNNEELITKNELRLPNNINCRVKGIPSDEMIIRLDNKGFAVSHKSACASQVDDTSYVIKALGASDIEAKENIRITLGRGTTKKDLDNLIVFIKDIFDKYSK